MLKVDPEKLLEAGAHFGHQIRRWNPRMVPFMYKIQDKVFVFDLIKTKEAFETALEVIKEASAKNKLILLVGTKKQAKEKIKEIGEKTGIAYVSERWLGGTLTNFKQIRETVKKLTDTKAKLEADEFANYTKKERLLINRQIERQERFLGGISGLDKIPEMMIIVDIYRERSALSEAKKLGVTTVGIVDSNCNPEEVTFPIPMNDDAVSALEYALDLIAEALLAGKKSRK